MRPGELEVEVVVEGGEMGPGVAVVVGDECVVAGDVEEGKVTVGGI